MKYAFPQNAFSKVYGGLHARDRVRFITRRIGIANVPFSLGAADLRASELCNLHFTVGELRATMPQCRADRVKKD